MLSPVNDRTGEDLFYDRGDLRHDFQLLGSRHGFRYYPCEIRSAGVRHHELLGLPVSVSLCSCATRPGKLGGSRGASGDRHTPLNGGATAVT